MTAATAHGLRGLVSAWKSGQKNIDPARSRDGFTVIDDVLYLRSRGDLVPLGVPVSKAGHWGFWYLVTLWRKRLVVRERLAGLGGFPVLPYELAGALRLQGRQHEADAVGSQTHDVYRDDTEMFEELLAWLATWLPKSTRVCWRGCEVLLHRDGMRVDRTVRGVTTSTSVILARRQDNLVIVGQVYRSQHVLWLRDAVYVAVSRLLGRGILSEYTVWREGRVGLMNEGRVLPVPSTPAWPF